MERLLNDPGFHAFCNEFLPSLDTGVSELIIKTEKYKESNIRDDAELLEDVLEDLEKGEKAVPLIFDNDTPAVVMFENGELVIKTLFYPLSDFAIRPDLNIEKGYLLGRFGAIPSLAHLKKLDWKASAHA